MSEKKVLLLHIGMPKSGTTSLQDFLYLNAGRLKKYGWCYPDLIKDMAYLTDEKSEEGQKNGLCLRRSIIKNWSKKKIDILWDNILNYLKYDNVIISDEVIGASPIIDTEKALQNFCSYYDNIKVIFYLRRQDLFIESLWNQDIKRNLNGDPISVFLKTSPYAVIFSDYLSRIRMMEKIIGRENIIIRIFEKEQFLGKKSDVISDFLVTLGSIGDKEIPEDEDWLSPKRVNSRLDGDTLWMKMIFNRKYSQYSSAKNDVVNDLFIDNNIPGDEKCGYLSRAERDSIIVKYQHGNETIAREYLNRKDGKLFYNMDLDIPLYIPDVTEREQYLIDLFAKIISEEEKRYAALGSKQTGIKNGIKMGASRFARDAGGILRNITTPVRWSLLKKQDR